MILAKRGFSSVQKEKGLKERHDSFSMIWECDVWEDKSRNVICWMPRHATMWEDLLWRAFSNFQTNSRVAGIEKEVLSSYVGKVILLLLFWAPRFKIGYHLNTNKINMISRNWSCVTKLQKHKIGNIGSKHLRSSSPTSCSSRVSSSSLLSLTSKNSK